jgi:hypothetical protein
VGQKTGTFSFRIRIYHWLAEVKRRQIEEELWTATLLGWRLS